MENEAYNLAYHMAWVFFPCFLLIAMLQLILFCLFNHKYHPFVDLLDDANYQGMYNLGVSPSLVSRYCEGYGFL